MNKDASEVYLKRLKLRRPWDWRNQTVIIEIYFDLLSVTIISEVDEVELSLCNSS
jgi:hypothetical protein